MSIVNPAEILDNAYKAFVFKLQQSEQLQAHLYAQGIRYCVLQDDENLEDLLGGHLQEMIK